MPFSPLPKFFVVFTSPQVIEACSLGALDKLEAEGGYSDAKSVSKGVAALVGLLQDYEVAVSGLVCHLFHAAEGIATAQVLKSLGANAASCNALGAAIRDRDGIPFGIRERLLASLDNIAEAVLKASRGDMGNFQVVDTEPVYEFHGRFRTFVPGVVTGLAPTRQKIAAAKTSRFSGRVKLQKKRNFVATKKAERKVAAVTKQSQRQVAAAQAELAAAKAGQRVWKERNGKAVAVEGSLETGADENSGSIGEHDVEMQDVSSSMGLLSLES